MIGDIIINEKDLSMTFPFSRTVRCSSHLVIQDPVGHLGSPGQVSYVLSENAEGRSEQPNLQLQLMCCTSTSHMGHIFSGWDLGTWEVENHWKVVRCVIASTRREMLVLVDFQDDYYSINYWIIY